ncbi:uncharacterized protein LOC124372991 [Homalodisca vitripennis]|uniref:uncharacterized protein LOC124372991 n=1 Tax=Homalodisca vitripennis TaxID=197043 RepID=UPI001EEA5808|nr:uncharacterized protein LOC124372991 [Homalodisca vitripennis]
MSGNRGEAAGVGGGLHYTNSRLASVPAPNPSSIIPSTPGNMTRIVTSASDNAAVARASNGLPNESRSIVDLLNSSPNLMSSLTSPGHHRTQKWNGPGKWCAEAEVVRYGGGHWFKTEKNCGTQGGAFKKNTEGICGTCHGVADSGRV